MSCILERKGIKVASVKAVRMEIVSEVGNNKVKSNESKGSEVNKSNKIVILIIFL